MVTLVGGLVGIVSAAIGIVAAVWGNDDPGGGAAPSQDNPETAVERCMFEHGLDRAFEKNEGGTAGTILFRQCSWPDQASRFKPGRDESIVMSNSRYQLDSARWV